MTTPTAVAQTTSTDKHSKKAQVLTIYVMDYVAKAIRSLAISALPQRFRDHLR